MGPGVRFGRGFWRDTQFSVSPPLSVSLLPLKGNRSDTLLHDTQFQGVYPPLECR